MDVKYSYYTSSKGYKVVGGTDTKVLLDGGGSKSLEELVKVTANGKSIDFTGDLNTLVKTGFYNGTGLNNAPNAGWFYILVEGHTNSDDWVLQTIVSFGAGNEANKTFQRVRAGGTWTDWSEFLQIGTGVNVGFSTYTPDGLFNPSAKSFKLITPGAKTFMIGYRDYGSGQYLPRLGFESGGIRYSMGLNNEGNFTVGVDNSDSEDFISLNEDEINAKTIISSEQGFKHAGYDDPTQLLTSDGGVMDANNMVVRRFKNIAGITFPIDGTDPATEWECYSNGAGAIDLQSGSFAKEILIKIRQTGSIGSINILKNGMVVYTLSAQKKIEILGLGNGSFILTDPNNSVSTF